MQIHAARPRKRGMTGPSLSAMLLVLSAVCGCSPPRNWQVGWPVVTLQLNEGTESERGEPIELLSRVIDGAFTGGPLEDRWRPVTVIDVLSVNELLMRTDRGVEQLTILGLSALDPRLDQTINEAFRGPLLTAVSNWFNDPQAKIYEGSLAAYGTRGAAAGPCYLSREGRRFVTLARWHPDDGENLVDFRSVALEQGWAYPSHPVTDHLGTDPRMIFNDLSRGFAGEPAAQLARDSFVADSAAVNAMSQQQHQELGDGLHHDIAQWLGWQPQTPLVFQPMSVAEFRPLMQDFVASARERALALAVETAQSMRQQLQDQGSEATVEWRHEGPSIEELADVSIDSLNGYSPEGPTIFILPKNKITRRQLQAVLVHEVMHQYQEEVFDHPRGFPPLVLPGQLGEAHAEVLSMSFRAERLQGFHLRGAIAYSNAVEHFLGIMRETGLSADELYRKYLHQDWDNEHWLLLLNFQIGLQEFLFAQLSMTTYDGLDFEALRALGTSADKGIVVRITNTREAPFAGQFHGQWIWQLNDGRDGTVTLTSPPFNLHLPPLASITVRLNDEDTFSKHPPGKIIGLFGRTPSAP
ncbi:MAG: hypothetical protein ACI9EF_003879 [Pseudohongiellaceae bacterium]|jgi:hypothetical protein